MKEIQLQLGIVETNYETVTQDFNKSQELLNLSCKREVELQQMLTSLVISFTFFENHFLYTTYFILCIPFLFFSYRKRNFIPE